MPNRTLYGYDYDDTAEHHHVWNALINGYQQSNRRPTIKICNRAWTALLIRSTCQRPISGRYPMLVSPAELIIAALLECRGCCIHSTCQRRSSTYQTAIAAIPARYATQRAIRAQNPRSSADVASAGTSDQPKFGKPSTEWDSAFQCTRCFVYRCCCNHHPAPIHSKSYSEDVCSAVSGHCVSLRGAPGQCPSAIRTPTNTHVAGDFGRAS